MPTRLLILACSHRKQTTTQPLPPIQRYDGPAWRVLRRYRHLVHDPDLTVLALSARYGIIHASAATIAAYDEQLTHQKASDADWTASQVLAPLTVQLAQIPTLEHICLCGGRLYRTALAQVAWPEHVPLLTTRGGIGQQLHQLTHWLHTAR